MSFKLELHGGLTRANVTSQYDIGVVVTASCMVYKTQPRFYLQLKVQGHSRSPIMSPQAAALTAQLLLWHGMHGVVFDIVTILNKHFQIWLSNNSRSLKTLPLNRADDMTSY